MRDGRHGTTGGAGRRPTRWTRGRRLAALRVAALRLAALGAVAIGGAGAAGGCRRAGAEGAAGGGGAVTLAGSTSLQPLAERWAERYAAVPVTVQAGGSTAGIRAARDGTADVGMSSRPLAADERAGLREHTVAIDGIAVVVHPRNPVRALTRAQLRDVFAGRVRSWRLVGGPDWPVIVVTREDGSGTRATFEELVMGELPIAGDALVTGFSGGLRRMVADDPRAIGYMTISQLLPGARHPVRAVAIDGVHPAEGSIASGAYPLHRPLLFLTGARTSAATAAFLQWVGSPAGQAVVRAERLVPVPTTTSAGAVAPGAASPAAGRAAAPAAASTAR